MRAARLLSLMLLLQARGRMTAAALAAELEVSVRTIYRDLEALSAAGVPVFAEAGPGGGCQLLDGYRSPIAGLRPEEAAALLALGVPEPMRELGLGPAFLGGQRRVGAAAAAAAGDPLVHLDMPRWFHTREAVPQLAALAEAVRGRDRLVVAYRRRPGERCAHRTIEPLGLVNKSGVWYVVAATARHGLATFRVARVESVRQTGERFTRPPQFDLEAHWAAWSAAFEAGLPRLEVTVRASPTAQATIPEVFGDGGRAAVAAAGPADAEGWRIVTLTFEHEGAAVHRLAGFGGTVEVVSPASVRSGVVDAATATLRRHGRLQPGRAGPR